MLRVKPRLAYKGLSVVLSNPSRFDRASILTATGGTLFNDYCLRPDMNVMQCDIRLADEPSPFLPGTKAVLLCGEYAMKKHLPETANNTIGEMRGSPFCKDGLWYVPSFVPQDAADAKAHEHNLNPLAAGYCPDDDDYKPDEDDDGDSKKHGKTAWRNYSFWLRADTAKCKRIIANDGKLPPSPHPAPSYVIAPPAEVVCHILEKYEGRFMYFDIETDYQDANLQCFAFSFDGQTIYSVPILDNTYKPYYPTYYRIMRSLAIAISRNTVVAHNGAAFDFFVLGYKYRIPINKCYDTLLAMHRCFPDVEKSLGHCVSYWCYEKFHKDEDAEAYFTRDQMFARLRYCGKDVYTMFLVHKAIERYAATIPGLQHSIDSAMRSIKPYVLTSLQGIKYSQAAVDEVKAENDLLMTQYNRMIELLIGPKGMADIRAQCKSKKMLPGSNPQCVLYFHDLLGYPVLGRSKETEEPSLAKQVMFKLALQHDNPVIQLILAYRHISKEYGTLKFNPWKDNDNKVTKGVLV